MLMHIVRIDSDLLRIPLLCLVWPASFIFYVASAAMPSKAGGHPNKKRMLQTDFYSAPIGLFLAAWDGLFVPTSKEEP